MCITVWHMTSQTKHEIMISDHEVNQRYDYNYYYSKRSHFPSASKRITVLNSFSLPVQVFGSALRTWGKSSYCWPSRNPRTSWTVIPEADWSPAESLHLCVYPDQRGLWGVEVDSAGSVCRCEWRSGTCVAGRCDQKSTQGREVFLLTELNWSSGPGCGVFLDSGPVWILLHYLTSWSLDTKYRSKRNSSVWCVTKPNLLR